MYPSTLAHALSTSPRIALAHLRIISVLTSTNIPISNYSVSTSLYAARSEALFHLLRHILPLIFSPSAISTQGPQHLLTAFTSLLQALRSNASLPSLLPAPPLPSYIQPFLIPLPSSAFDDVSTSLAQVASTDADELTELWNRLVPDNIVSSTRHLPAVIRTARTAVETAQTSAISLDMHTAITRATALTTLQNTLRNVLSALETDSAEHAEHLSADNVYVRLLCARSRAITAKLELLRAEIAASMYTPECASALRVIAREVKSKTASIESQLMHKKLRLQQCNALGAEYLQVVQHLRKAKSLLEHKLWARHELNTVH